jgi:uncharacterized protein YlxP (DUF503 family)
MVVGTLKIEFRLSENRSLKGKRKVVRSMVDKVKSRFNVAIAEVGANDKWQKIELGVCTVGNDFLDSLYVAQIVNTKMEIFNL